MYIFYHEAFPFTFCTFICYISRPINIKKEPISFHFYITKIAFFHYLWSSLNSLSIHTGETMRYHVIIISFFMLLFSLTKNSSISLLAKAFIFRKLFLQYFLNFKYIGKYKPIVLFSDIFFFTFVFISISHFLFS